MRLDLDPEGLVDSRPGIEVHAVGPVEFGEDFDFLRAASGIAECLRFPGGDFVAFGVEEVFVPGGGEIGDPVSSVTLLHGRRDRAFLEERLFEIGDVVGDHLGSGAFTRFGEPFDVFGEAEHVAG